MSAPMPHDSDKLQGALCEVVSAMSALNMEPDPLKEPIGRGFYLSERDGWAAHCMEHLHAVFELLNAAHKERELLKNRIYHLEVEVAKAKSWRNP